jgi:hypothetical protein
VEKCSLEKENGKFSRHFFEKKNSAKILYSDFYVGLRFSVYPRRREWNLETIRDRATTTTTTTTTTLEATIALLSRLVPIINFRILFEIAELVIFAEA